MFRDYATKSQFCENYPSMSYWGHQTSTSQSCLSFERYFDDKHICLNKSLVSGLRQGQWCVTNTFIRVQVSFVCLESIVLETMHLRLMLGRIIALLSYQNLASSKMSVFQEF